MNSGVRVAPTPCVYVSMLGVRDYLSCLVFTIQKTTSCTSPLCFLVPGNSTLVSYVAATGSQGKYR